MNIYEYLIGHLPYPNSLAILHGQETHSYADVKRTADKTAFFLLECGLKPGDRVGIIGDSSLLWVGCYLACLSSGMVAVPVPTNIETDKLSRILISAEPEMVICEDRYVGKYLEVLKTRSLVTFYTPHGNAVACLASELDKPPSVSGKPLSVGSEDDLAVLMFTSGSTGDPRGVMVTHRNIISNTDSIIDYLSLSGKDRIMSVLPFYYCFGTSLLHTHLKVGGTVVLENSFLFPEKILDRMEDTGCTGLAGVPSTFQILLRNSTFKSREFHSLRYFQQAGGKLPDSFIREMIDAFPDKELFVMYGQTEATARLSYLPPELLDSKMGSIGKGIKGVRLEVLNNEGQSVQEGETGEIVASGENITAGYWKDREETENVFRDGKLHTGDLATIDGEGFIYIVDRQKNFIKCAGHRVGSKEIENIIVGMAGVIEAAVVAVPDEKLGEAVGLFVSHVDAEKAADKIIEYCRENIKWPFTPKHIKCFGTLPKNSSGKIDTALLKEKFLPTFISDQST